MQTCTEQLGKYVADTAYEKLPEEVIAQAKLRVLDVIGIGLSGSKTDVSRISKFCREHGGEGASTIWGTDIKTSPEYAALANATMTFHLELDDVHRTSHTHPGVSCIPAALAIAEEKHMSGKELIEAVVVGYDSAIRMGLTVSPSIYTERTYLAPGTLSIFGAAASAAKLYKQDAETAGRAIGAGSYYGPIACYEAFKTGAGIKDMIMGWGNLCGIYAAQLAAEGFGGADFAIEGDFGFCKTAAVHYDTSRLSNRLGTYHEILFTGVKPYACCRQHHAAIDCMLEIREKYGIQLENVDHVKVRTFVVSSRGNKKRPTTVQEAKYSIPYIMGVALKYGEVWREQFTDELINTDELVNFAANVEVVPDAELDKLYDEKWPSIVEVTTKDKKMLSARHDLPKGEPEFACSEADMISKFMSLAGDAKTTEECQKIAELIMNLENTSDVNKITRLL